MTMSPAPGATRAWSTDFAPSVFHGPTHSPLVYQPPESAAEFSRQQSPYASGCSLAEDDRSPKIAPRPEQRSKRVSATFQKASALAEARGRVRVPDAQRLVWSDPLIHEAFISNGDAGTVDDTRHAAAEFTHR